MGPMGWSASEQTEPSDYAIPEHVRRLVEEMEDVPTLPVVVTEFARVSADPDVAAHKLADVIGTDPALTSRLLHIVNSPFYGLSGRVTTVESAIVVMGSKAVRAAVLGAAVLSAFTRGDARAEYSRFAHHAALTAEATKALGRAYRLRGAEELHTAGLLHDVGKLLIQTRFPEQHREVVRHGESSGLPAMVSERKFLGATHAELGSWLTSHWRLPELLVECITFHHSPTDADRCTFEVALTHVADHVAHHAESIVGIDSPACPINAVAWQTLHSARPDIEQEDIGLIAEDMAERITSIQQMAAVLC